MYKYESFKTGEGFHQVAIDIIPDNLFSKDDDYHWFVPSIVNMAFACELYIKSILSDGDSETKGHDLYDLFDKLNEEDKTIIIKDTKRKGTDDFYASLNDSRNLFENWRYHFEKNKSCSINIIFLENFTLVLHDFAEKSVNNTTSQLT